MLNDRARSGAASGEVLRHREGPFGTMVSARGWWFESALLDVLRNNTAQSMFPKTGKPQNGTMPAFTTKRDRKSVV